MYVTMDFTRGVTYLMMEMEAWIKKGFNFNDRSEFQKV